MIKQSILFSTALLILLFILPGAIATTISTVDVFSEPGETLNLPIIIEDVNHVGTVDITIFYDQSIVQAIGAANSEFDFMHPVINNSAGYIRVGGMAYGDGLSGNVKLADLMLEAVGSTNDTSVLSITINELKIADPTETTIPSDIANSTFNIIDPPGIPTGLISTTGCHWIKWTWATGLNNDFVEVNLNGVWVENYTAQSYNSTVLPHVVQTISLRGYNCSLNKYSSFINQTVTLPNNPPIAIARSLHQYNNVGSVYGCDVILDASASCDPDGSITHFEWNFNDDTEGTGELVEHVYVSHFWNGTSYISFTVSLTVTDDLDPLINNTITLPVNVYIAGDANGDGRVNVLDATLVGILWDETCTNYWECNDEGDKADLNNDCEVNVLDAVIIGTCWDHTAN